MPDQNIHADRLLILDFGSQYSQLIARRVREAGVYCELHAHDVGAEFVRAYQPRGIILSGGPLSAHATGAPLPDPVLYELGVPILGICYGMQAMAVQLGGAVAPAKQREYGYAQLRLHGQSRLFQGIADQRTADGEALLDVWMSHGDRVEMLPPGFAAIAATEHAPLASIADATRNFYGVQFHPEVTHTPQGARIIARFCHAICGCGQLWTPARIVDDAIERARATVGAGQVLLGLSGGVDSAVVGALLHRAIGERLVCVFVDHGLLRQGESEQVMATFARHLGARVVRVDAAPAFFAALAGVTDPEEKRRRIGGLFIEVFEREAARLAGIEWLAQGTIYPDVIESAGAASGKAKSIKSHHNVGGLPQRMRLKLIEPLRELFKDEVRAIGRELGLPEDWVGRHPFPGPGLAVRVLGETRPEFVATLRLADAIFIEELRNHGLYDRVAQAFAVFLPVRSVGVVGDNRLYAHVIALRAVETVDFMTARWAELPATLLDLVARRIVNEVPDVSRVVYDITGKPPGTIEWE